jgi:hypothetical protein
MTTETKPTYEQLKVLAMQALTDGNDTEFLKISAQMRSFKSDIAKAEAEKLKKEAEALSGVRTELAGKIHARIMSQMTKLVTELATVKATGFTFKVDAPDATGTMINYKSVELTVPTVKTKTARTGGGGSTGKSKSEFGLTLDEIYQKFKTSEDEAKMSEAIAKDEDVKAKTGKSNSVNQYNVKLGVKKAAIASGNLKPLS